MIIEASVVEKEKFTMGSCCSGRWIASCIIVTFEGLLSTRPEEAFSIPNVAKEDI